MTSNEKKKKQYILLVPHIFECIDSQMESRRLPHTLRHWIRSTPIQNIHNKSMIFCREINIHFWKMTCRLIFFYPTLVNINSLLAMKFFFVAHIFHIHMSSTSCFCFCSNRIEKNNITNSHHWRTVSARHMPHANAESFSKFSFFCLFFLYIYCV